jgi:hypothetical protein
MMGELAQGAERVAAFVGVEKVEIVVPHVRCEIATAVDHLAHGLGQRRRDRPDGPRPALFTAIPAEQAVIAHPGVELANGALAFSTGNDTLFLTPSGQQKTDDQFTLFSHG